MPSAVVATPPGAAGQNSYVTVAEVTAYFDDRPTDDSVWTDADADDQARAVLYASKLMDALFQWTGHAVSETQGLLWPRYGMYYRNSYYVPSDVIPDELKDATAEFAKQLLEADRTDDNAIETLGLKKLKAGPVALEWDEDTAAKVVPDVVVNLLPDAWYTSIGGRNNAIRDLMRA